MKQEISNWPVCGHKSASRYLRDVIKNDRLTHAYLFYGPSSVGKFHTASLFAQSILCENRQNDQATNAIPCEFCSTCSQMKKGIHPDLFIVGKGKKDKNIPIEKIKELQHKLSVTSLLGQLKIGLIDNAECLSPSAANALLKTLEEPSDHTLIILISNNLSELPKTIISRCSLLHFNLVSTKEIIQFLIEKGVTRNKAEPLAHVSFGRPGKAAGFHGNPRAFNEYLAAQGFFINLLKSDRAERFKLVNSILSEKKERSENLASMIDLIDIWLATLRDIIHYKLKVGYFALIPQKRVINQIADNTSLADLNNILARLAKLKANLTANINIRANLEYYLLTI